MNIMVLLLLFIQQFANDSSVLLRGDAYLNDPVSCHIRVQTKLAISACYFLRYPYKIYKIIDTFSQR